MTDQSRTTEPPPHPAGIGILGATGFVGSTLARALPTARGFDSRTVRQAEGARFETLFCAAAPGSMFEANKFPDRDAARIDALISSVSRMRADTFVLISTIAVLDRFDGGYAEAGARYQETIPYGVNRRRLEVACRDRFRRCLVVRLPALFGPGLAKNFVFDLMNPMPTMLTAAAHDTLATTLPALARVYAFDPGLGMHVIDRRALAALPGRAALVAEAAGLGIDAVMFHNRETTYQFYDMSRLAADIALALDAGLEVLHLAPAPLRTAEIHRRLKGGEMPRTGARLHTEDMRTGHADLWSADGPYMQTGAQVLDALERFYRAGGGAGA